MNLSTWIFHTLGKPQALGLVARLGYMRPMSMSFYQPKKVSEAHPSAEWARMSKEVCKLEQKPADPYSGRSVWVANGNLTDAFKKLDTILFRNKVRAEARKSERHEQKGAKRRRLSSERWRKRFAHEVRLKVQLVQKIRRRGA